MKDGYKLKKDGEIISVGDGHIEPAPDEVLEIVEDMESDQEVIEFQKSIDAAISLQGIKESPRNFVAKYQCAVEYLAFREQTPEPENTDRLALVDPDQYPEIYDELFHTHDLISWGPTELCQRIVSGHELWVNAVRRQASQQEAKLRRRKLLAEADISAEHSAAFVSPGPTST